MFDGKIVGILIKVVFDMEIFYGLIFWDNVFDGGGQEMVIVRQICCEWGVIVEGVVGVVSREFDLCYV